ncbi:hypothetical protein HK436_15710 [Mesorhizobium sediminum]|nr:hypothetical protein [Mesorhizobium sediminum]
MSQKPARVIQPSEPAHVDATKNPVTISTEDGFPLGGTLWQGDGDGPLVLISSATAVPQASMHALRPR